MPPYQTQSLVDGEWRPLRHLNPSIHIPNSVRWEWEISAKFTQIICVYFNGYRATLIAERAVHPGHVPYAAYSLAPISPLSQLRRFPRGT